MMEWLDGARNSIPAAQRELRPRVHGAVHARQVARRCTREHDVREAARVFTGWTSNPSLPHRGVQRRRPRHRDQDRARHQLGDAGRPASTPNSSTSRRAARRAPASSPPSSSPNFAYAPATSAHRRPARGRGGRHPARVATGTCAPRCARCCSPTSSAPATPRAQRLLIRQPAEVMVATRQGVRRQPRQRRRGAAAARHGPGACSCRRTSAGSRAGLGVAVARRRSSPATAGPATVAGVQTRGSAGVERHSTAGRGALGLAALSAETAASLRDYVAERTPKLTELNKQVGVLALLLTSPDWMASVTSLTRRSSSSAPAAVAGASVVGVAGPAFGAAAVDPATSRRNRLVVIFLEGGNDGLNYVVPRGDVAGAPRLSVYRRVRPTIAYAPNRLLPLDRRRRRRPHARVQPEAHAPARAVPRRARRHRARRRLPEPQLLALRVVRHLALG